MLGLVVHLLAISGYLMLGLMVCLITISGCLMLSLVVCLIVLKSIMRLRCLVVAFKAVLEFCEVALKNSQDKKNYRFMTRWNF